MILLFLSLSLALCFSRSFASGKSFFERGVRAFLAGFSVTVAIGDDDCAPAKLAMTILSSTMQPPQFYSAHSHHTEKRGKTGRKNSPPAHTHTGSTCGCFFNFILARRILPFRLVSIKEHTEFLGGITNYSTENNATRGVPKIYALLTSFLAILAVITLPAHKYTHKNTHEAEHLYLYNFFSVGLGACFHTIHAGKNAPEGNSLAQRVIGSLRRKRKHKPRAHTHTRGPGHTAWYTRHTQAQTGAHTHTRTGGGLLV